MDATNSSTLELSKPIILNPKNKLCRYEFLECLVRIAVDKYIRHKKAETILEAVSLFMDLLLPTLKPFM